jgi:hypothetical protein
MRKTALLFPLIIFCILLSASRVYAQAAHIAPHPPPVHVNKYKKKDTIRVSPYVLDTLLAPIPMKRAYFHDKIDKEQKRADDADGFPDWKVHYGNDSAGTAVMTHALLHNVDRIQIIIENMPANGRDSIAENQQKIRYLQALWELMRQYNGDPKPTPDFYNKLVANMHDMLIAANDNKLMDFVVANTNVYTLDNGKVLLDNQPTVRSYLYTQMGKTDPVMMARRLQDFAMDTFASRIIRGAALRAPDLVFNYATSTNDLLKNAVAATPDQLVQAIVKIATTSKAPLKALPMLGDVYYGRKTIEEIDSIAERPSLYFENLVRLKLENDTIARHIYTEELKYRALTYFVRQMNELHEAKDNIRFSCIDSIPPGALYFIMIYGQDEIYTSSFLGTFKRMMERMKPTKGDELLTSLHYDHFRTFIRMCAGYNTLSDFLGTMEDSAKTTLMTSFIGGLQKGRADDLEDAVDVADAFGSIKDSALSVFLQNKVRENYELSYKEASKKGVVVYSLLAMLFEGNKISGSDTGAAVASARLHLPSINKVPFRSLVNDSGIVYQQVFFFGDEDGVASYDSYLDDFKKNPKWKISTDSFWTVISSTEGKRIEIYANRPLPEPQDEEATDSLINYLDSNNIHPTIMIHRGHSYHLPFTLSKLNKQVRIVILGSCGGYHNLSIVLDHSPDAHIVSSKQTGVMAINEPIIRSLNTMLLDGADINWITMWHELDEYFQKRKDLLERYDDYVPPYKNLGAIFIKAYRQIMK